MSEIPSAEDVRERRRLKILARAEERMQKLTNSTWNDSDSRLSATSLDHADSDNHPAMCFTHSPARTKVHSNGSAPVDQPADGLFLSQPDEEEATPAMDMLLDNQTEKSPLTRPPLAPVDESDFMTYTATAASRSQSTGSRRSIRRVDSRLILWLALGVVLRLSFLCSIGQNYVQSSFNPFIAIEIAVFGYERAVGMAWKDNVSGMMTGMWLYVFQQLGIDAGIIGTYRRILATVSVIADHFAAYFFAFILTHVLLQICYIQ